MHAGLPAVMAERVQLQQVLLNLIMNAIEAMSSVTGRERHLRISSGLDEQANVRITVEDTGSGIAPALLDRIFDPFFTTKSKGMGLGLFICRSIVEAYGGRLWATPRSPNGAAFHLSLPGVETAARGDLNQGRGAPLAVHNCHEPGTRCGADHGIPVAISFPKAKSGHAACR
jgi:C4-dicarboxylate-specific signal transduction histidine kinase